MLSKNYGEFTKLRGQLTMNNEHLTVKNGYS